MRQSNYQRRIDAKVFLLFSLPFLRSSAFHTQTHVTPIQTPPSPVEGGTYHRISTNTLQSPFPKGTRSSSTPTALPMMFERMSEPLINALITSQSESARLNRATVDTEAMLLGIIDHPQNARKTFQRYKITFTRARRTVDLMEQQSPSSDVQKKEEKKGWGGMIQKTKKARDVELPFAPRLKKVLNGAVQIADGMESQWIHSEHVLLSLMDYDMSKGRVSNDEEYMVKEDVEGGAYAVIYRVLEEVGGGSSNGGVFTKSEFCRALLLDLNDESVDGENQLVAGGGKGDSKTPTLSEVGVDLTEMAVNQELDRVYNRDEEIYMALRTLLRRRKNNPCLIGDPGVGKTAIVEGIAQIIAAPRMIQRLQEISDKAEDFTLQKNQEELERLSGLAKLCPPKLTNHRVVSIELGNLVAGTKYRGEFEERIQGIMEELSDPSAPPTICFIDEIHTLIGAGSAEGGIDAANILKPALARGKIQLIGATTIMEYRKCIETDMALERRLQPLTIKEPSKDSSMQILRSIQNTYEKHHGVEYTDASLEAMVKLSERYVTDRFLPDKAIDLLDECGAMAHMQHIKNNDSHDNDSTKVVVNEHTVAQVMSEWTSIPIGKLETEETTKLINLEDELTRSVRGQYRAVHAVSRAVRRARSGLRDQNRPVASFLFCGPTGVGKTELCKTLAESYFKSRKDMVRIDMSEYMEKHSVSRLTGPPPGYVGYEEGGQLTEAVRRAPHSVVLLDELEKAHGDVLNVLLQIMEDGMLTDGKGRTVSFKNVILVMTSNVGSRRILEVAGDHDRKRTENGGGRVGVADTVESTSNGELEPPTPPTGKRKRGRGRVVDETVPTAEEEAEALLTASEYAEMCTVVKEELENSLKPELLNRIDEIVVFSPLRSDDLRSISRLLLQDTMKRAHEERDITLKVSDCLIDQVMKEGSASANRFGARPMRRAVQRFFEDTVSDSIIRGFLKNGDCALVELGNEEGTSVRVRRESDGEVMLSPVQDGQGGIGSTVASEGSGGAAARKVNGDAVPEPDAVMN
mmetsp:Transcript_31237/g.46185  ORF Transcript_31237/g.46185 Transcript_31237/m.46185 type:complete len:1030 (+) Transcript_31237:221-3310(+)|eukprot:CAMPEP_0195535590 /NCGR_PEP_ID=MMETSP0794_2-20130614/44547_1 /TAXON_ID=515487 /ORGANISM="Stephanopyxis turris, Strain CCMP 815" /LENGTH=1029 /DNA_ID=CAMNT_0040668775 /DNA_START=220 /DNA_END=3309 /DNA_ORIENTATION=-